MPPTSPAAHLSRIEFIALVAALMALNALAIDVLLPALPYLGEAHQVSDPNHQQLVIGAYMLGFGAAQIAFGPISDRYGRRAPLLLGIIVYIAAAFAAIAAPSFGALLALRLVQGLGAAGTRVIAISVVRDCYAGRAMAEIMSLVFMVFMVVPVIAPGIGQVLLLTGPWQYVFVFMGGLATIVGVWAFARLPETLPAGCRRPLSFASVMQGFEIVLSNRVAVSYGAAGIFLFAAILGFITQAQQIYVGLYGLGALFPVAFAGMAVMMAISSFLNSRVVMRVGMRRMSHFAILAHVVVAGALLLASAFGQPPLWLFFGCIATIMFMFGWSSSNMNSLSMEPLGAVAGTASAVFGFSQTVGGAILGTLIGQNFDGTVRPAAAGYFICGLGALMCCLIAENGRLFGAGAAPVEAKSVIPPRSLAE